MLRLPDGDLTAIEFAVALVIVVAVVLAMVCTYEADLQKPATARWFGEAGGITQYIICGVIAGSVVSGPILLAGEFLMGRQLSVSPGEHVWLATLGCYIIAILVNQLFPGPIAPFVWALVQITLSVISSVLVFARNMPSMHYVGCLTSISAGVFVAYQLFCAR